MAKKIDQGADDRGRKRAMARQLAAGPASDGMAPAELIDEISRNVGYRYKTVMQQDSVFNTGITQGETILKKNLTVAAGLIAGAVLLMGAGPAMAHVDVGINIGIPGVIAPPVYVQPAPTYVQPAPVYVQPGPVYIERGPDREWHERRRRAREWRERHHHEDYRGGYYRHDD